MLECEWTFDECRMNNHVQLILFKGGQSVLTLAEWITRGESRHKDARGQYLVSKPKMYHYFTAFCYLVKHVWLHVSTLLKAPPMEHWCLSHHWATMEIPQKQKTKTLIGKACSCSQQIHNKCNMFTLVMGVRIHTKSMFWFDFSCFRGSFKQRGERESLNRKWWLAPLKHLFVIS